eukprot:gene95-102_t
MRSVVTSSTKEFDQFVDDRLESSRKAYADRRSRPVSAGSSLKHNHTINQNNNKDRTIIDDQDFFIGNSNKYIEKGKSIRSPASASRSTRLTTSSHSTRETGKEEPVAPIKLVHSWRAHLDYKSTRNIAVSLPQPDFAEPLASPTRSSRELKIVQSPFEGLRKAALSPRKHKSSSLYHDSVSYSDSDHTPQPSPLRAFPVPDYNSTMFSSEDLLASSKVRVVTLRRCLRDWKSYILAKRDRDAVLLQACYVLHKRWIKKTVLRNWYTICRAIFHHEKYTYFRCLKRWHQGSMRSKLSNYSAAKYGQYRSIRRVLRRLQHLVLMSRMLKKRINRRERARHFRRKNLLLSVFRPWRRVTKLATESRKLEEEHLLRRQKIHALLDKVGNQAKEEKPRPSSRSRLGTTTANSAAQNRISKDMGAKSQRPPTSSRLSNRVTATITSDRRSKEPPPTSVMEDISSQPDHQSESLSSFEMPPSYSQIFAEAKESERKEEENKKIGGSSMRNGDGSGFDDRARAHKERLQALRQQAFERVQQRQAENDRAKQAKLKEEEAEAQRLREEARSRKEEEKAKNARLLALQNEQRRLLDRARVFYQRQLLIRCGLAPWRRFIEETRRLEDRAQRFREEQLMGRIWRALRGYVVSVKTERYRRDHQQTVIASAHFNRSLMRKVWQGWKMYRKVLRAKTIAITGHFSRFTLQRRAWQAWRVAFEKCHRELARAMRAMAPRGRKSVLKHFWRIWMTFYEQCLEEREIQNRAAQKWATVQSWLRDSK